MLRSLFHIILAFSLVLFAAACDSSQRSRFRSFGSEGWDSSDTVRLDVDSLRHGGDYELSVEMRISAASPCPYTSATVEIAGNGAGFSPAKPDTVTVPFTSGKGDKPAPGLSLYTYSVPFDTVSLPTGARCFFVMRHIMRLDPLTGVSDAGLRLRRIN